MTQLLLQLSVSTESLAVLACISSADFVSVS